MNEWQTLKCPCGGEEFYVLNRLIWREAGGLTEKKGGYICPRCKKPAQIERLINELKQRGIEQQLEELRVQKEGLMVPDEQPEVDSRPARANRL